MRGVGHAAVIVTHSVGGGGGALGVLRCLGRANISPLLVTEEPSNAATRSRYCAGFHHTASFASRPGEALELLDRIADRQPAKKPVLFPSSDPDLLFLSKHRSVLQERFHLVVPPSELVEVFCDKRRFASFASAHGFPVPETFSFADEAELARHAEALPYPIVIKPAMPFGWSEAALDRGLAGKKALILESPTALREALTLLGGGQALLVQEFVPGDDPEHYDVHLYLDADGRTLAAFTGQKERLTPPHAGSGCLVHSRWLPELAGQTAELLAGVGYRGVANVNFKRDPRTGVFRMLEVNPRVSTWNALPTACGVDIPLLAVADAVGSSPAKRAPQREGTRFLDFEADLSSALSMLRAGELSWPAYLRSLPLADTVYAAWAVDDPRPFMVSATRLRRLAAAKLLRDGWALRRSRHAA